MFAAAQKSGKKLTRSDGLPIGGVLAFANMLFKLLREGFDEVKPTHIAVVFDHSEKREFVYEHVWRVGDLLLWDNRCSSHARTDFPSSERRLMLRTTVQGTVRPY